MGAAGKYFATSLFAIADLPCHVYFQNIYYNIY